VSKIFERMVVVVSKTFVRWWMPPTTAVNSMPVSVTSWMPPTTDVNSMPVCSVYCPPATVVNSMSL
jgi:hypothetical protein